MTLKIETELSETDKKEFPLTFTSKGEKQCSKLASKNYLTMCDLSII